MTDGSSKAGRPDELVETNCQKNCPTHFFVKIAFTTEKVTRKFRLLLYFSNEPG
jgi:hypothetical protein